MTADKAAEMGCTPLAKIVGYADGATDPIDFPIAPKFALDKLLAQVFYNVFWKGFCRLIQPTQGPRCCCIV